MIKKFILAGSRVQYNYFIEKNNLNPNQFKNLTSMEQLQGQINPVIIKVGTYYMHPMHNSLCEWEKNFNV